MEIQFPRHSSLTFISFSHLWFPKSWKRRIKIEDSGETLTFIASRRMSRLSALLLNLKRQMSWNFSWHCVLVHFASTSTRNLHQFPRSKLARATNNSREHKLCFFNLCNLLRQHLITVVSFCLFGKNGRKTFMLLNCEHKIVLSLARKTALGCSSFRRFNELEYCAKYNLLGWMVVLFAKIHLRLWVLSIKTRLIIARCDIESSLPWGLWT